MDRELVERAKLSDQRAYELDPFGSDPPVYLEVPGGALDGLSWGRQR